MYKVRHIARELAANVAMGIPAIREARVRRGRTIGLPVQEKAEALLTQFAFFMDAIGWERLRGRTVLEIGPGDAVPLAPLFLGAGALRYIALDRFLGEVTGTRALELYQATLRIAPSRVLDGLRAIGVEPDAPALLRLLLRTPERVTLLNTGIEERVPRSAQGVDYIVSFNVCEHLADMQKSLGNMAALLARDGRMIHRIDYGPHDVWEGYENPLAFLTVPGPLWKLIAGNRGCPNRVRHAQLLDMARALGLAVEDRVGTRAPDAYVAQVRPHLAAEFRDLPDADLGVLDARLEIRAAR